MKPLLVGFGDSWTFGSELDIPQEQNWLTQLGCRLNADTVNMSTPASSIGHLAVQLFDFVKLQHTGQIVFLVGLTGSSRYLSYSNELDEFVNITPQLVYRTTQPEPPPGRPATGQPPDVIEHMRPLADAVYRYADCEQYRSFVTAQTILLFQNYCGFNNITVKFFSYFDMAGLSNYNQVINLEHLYPTTITQAMTGQEYVLPDILDNPYFAGKLFHPNQHGHERIAQILYDFLQTPG
jgi:hypothetical protein